MSIKYMAVYPIDIYASLSDEEIIDKPVMIAGSGYTIGTITGITRDKEEGTAIIHMDLEDSDLTRRAVESCGWEQDIIGISAHQERMDV